MGTDTRKRVVRFCAVAVALLFLSGTLAFVAALLAPAPRGAISPESAYESYRYYYGSAPQKKVTLTFDDGPAPGATERIIEVLKRHNAPATFFFIGEHVLAHPELAKKVVAEGFEVGNHTFTHSLAVHDSPERLAAELGATDRLIELATGRSTHYYRPPYLLAIGIDPAPNPWISSIAANQWALALGYEPVGIDIDPHDWDGRPPSKIVDRFKQVVTADAHIALFHDTPETALALDDILSWLAAEGYQVVPLAEVLSPAIAGATEQAPASLGTSLGVAYLYALSYLWRGLAVVGAVMLGLVLVRIAVIAALLARARRVQGPPPLTRYPLISVLIPAYNEEETIDAAVRSVLMSSYPRREVIVIDDGSTDKTLACMQRVAARYPKIVRVLARHNGGKASALFAGTRAARGDVVVVLDADAVLERRALHAFARHFADPRIGAVAGKVYPTSTRGLLAQFQALEYCVGQNIEKRATSVLGIVGVVPGPSGAWRAEALRNAGGFTDDTMVEDQDMTLTLLRQGWRVVYEPGAVAYTETPADVRGFLAQRFRWVYGTIQCFWKHAGVVWERPLSPMTLVLMPNIFIFGVVLPLLYPVIDSVLVASLLFGWWQEALVPILLFTLLDMLYAAWGLRGEGPYRRLIWAVPLLRVMYRQLLYYTVIRGLVHAVEGSGVSWGSIARLGQTRRFFEERLATPAN